MFMFYYLSFRKKFFDISWTVDTYFAGPLPVTTFDIFQSEEKVYTKTTFFLNLIVDVVPLSDGIPAITDRNGKQLKLQVLYEARGQNLGPAKLQVLSGFQSTLGAKVYGTFIQ